MELNSNRIYCFIEKYELEITHTLSLTISVWLIRLYFKNVRSENFDHLTKEEEKKLKQGLV